MSGIKHSTLITLNFSAHSAVGSVLFLAAVCERVEAEPAKTEDRTHSETFVRIFCTLQWNYSQLEQKCVGSVLTHHQQVINHDLNPRDVYISSAII